MTNVPFINKITNELSKRKLKSDVVANALLDISMSNDKIDEVLKIKSSASEIDATKNINKNTMIIDGDSIALQNGYKGSTIESLSYVCWANFLMRLKFSVITNNGVGGQRTDHLLARIQASIDLKPKYIHIMIGKNDIVQGISTDIIKANLLAIYQRCWDAGIIVIAGTITPNLVVQPSGTSSVNQIRDTYVINNWLKTLPSLYNNFILVDFFKALVNPSTSLAKTNILRDEIHPSAQGAYLMGLELYNVFNNKLMPVDLFSNGNLDTSNIVANPCLLGSVSGVPTNFAVYSNPAGAVSSKIVRDNGFEWTESTTTQLTEVEFYQVISNANLVGKKIKCIWEFEVPQINTEMHHFHLSCLVKTSGGAVVPNTGVAGLFHASSQAIPMINATMSGVIETDWCLIPATSARFDIKMQCKFNGKVRFGQVAILVKD